MGIPQSNPGGELKHAAGGKQVVVVALPAEDDPIREVSSEKEPHLTLAYLGVPNYTPDEMVNVLEYLEHAASQLHSFYGDVRDRGTLGEKKADVLFFNRMVETKVENFRSHLLKNELIARAYLSTDQFPDWIPHLTLGYPDAPAKKNKGRAIGSYSYIRFDRIALWTGDYSGPSYKLKNGDFDMATVHSDLGRQIADDVLKHHGVKGMKWGVRRTDAQLAGARPKASEDHRKAQEANRKASRAGTKTLSNKELQDAITRMNLERQYSSLTGGDSLSRGQSHVNRALKLGKTAEQVRQFLETPTGKAVKTGVKAAAAAGFAYATGGTGTAAAAGAGVAVRAMNNHYTNVGN